MLYNIWFEVSSLAFIVLIWIFYKIQYQNKNVINQRYQFLIVCIFCMTLTDILSAITISFHEHVPNVVNYVLNGSNFVFVGISGYAFVLYVMTLVYDTNFKVSIVNRIVVIAFILSELINPFFGYYYSFDETGYVHGPLYLVQMVVSYYFVLETGIVLLSNRHKLTHRKIVGTGSYVIMMFVIAVVQVFVIPNVLMTGFASTLTLLIILLLMETPDYYKLMNAMDELEKARVAANEANEAKSKFLANMSHEIRTPLNTVLGMDEMILRETTDKDILDYARNIKSSGSTLLGIINDILDFSKIESGMMTINPYDYELSSTVYNVYTMMNQKARDKGLSFEVHVNPLLPKRIKGDEMRISQIIINLTNNAIKYTEKGSVSLSVDFKECEKKDTILLCLAVKDTGIGIREEDRERLFEEFERLDVTKNRNIEGTGLGLAITSRLVHQMEGRVSVDSVYGEGSTFSVEFPQAVIDSSPMGEFRIKSVAQEDEEYKESFVAPNARILAVDDNMINLQVLKKLLKQTKVQIVTATSGKKALELLEENKFDLVLLDHMMPEMDGIEVLHRAKELEKKTGFYTNYIVLTANAIQGADKMYLSEGFSDYLSKPVNSKELEKKIFHYLPQEVIEG